MSVRLCMAVGESVFYMSVSLYMAVGESVFYMSVSLYIWLLVRVCFICQ